MELEGFVRDWRREAALVWAKSSRLSPYLASGEPALGAGAAGEPDCEDGEGQNEGGHHDVGHAHDPKGVGHAKEVDVADDHGQQADDEYGHGQGLAQQQEDTAQGAAEDGQGEGTVGPGRGLLDDETFGFGQSGECFLADESLAQIGQDPQQVPDYAETANGFKPER